MGSAQPFEVRQQRTGRRHRRIPAGESDPAAPPVLERAFEAAREGAARLPIVNGAPAVERVSATAGERRRLPVVASERGQFAPIRRAAR